jgi:ABC-2 type transport system permease protein
MPLHESQVRTTPSGRTPAAPARTSRRFSRYTRAEWVKLRSLRSSKAILGASALLLAAVAAGLTAALIPSRGDISGPAAFFDAALVGVQLTSMLLAGLGAASIAGEFGTGTAGTTFTVAPARTLVLAAKALVVLAAAAVAGAVGLAAGYALSTLQLAEHDLTSPLSSPGVLRALAGNLLYLSGISVFGLGIGALLRNTAAAVCALVAILYALPITLALLPSSAVADFLGRWWPTNTVSNLTQLISDPDRLPPAAGALAFLGWVVAAFVAGAARLNSRDV